METIVEAIGLSKQFGDFQAVDNLSFKIDKGEVYGLLGQNGAGKSTTMRMLLGLIFPDNGAVHIMGQPFDRKNRHLLQHVGAIIERPDMYGYLSGWDNLKIFAALNKAPIPDSRLRTVLDQVGLSGREKDKVKAYSQGMKQRLGVAIALIHEPELLILDEPTNGLDPQGIADMRELIRTISTDMGKTVLISSHLLHEIEQVATRMLVLHRGKKIAEGSVKDLVNPGDTPVTYTLASDVDGALPLEGTEWEKRLVEVNGASLQFRVVRDKIPELTRWLADNGASIMEVKINHTLEDYFLSVTK